MEQRTAVIFGGTGLVGRALIEELLKSDNYRLIKTFSRRETNYPETSGIINYIVDFDHPESFAENITGDDLFICLGTTIKKAGSVSRMEQIDRDLPVIISESALRNKVKRIAVVSSIGADKNSSNYYLRIKGEMEQAIMNLDFDTTALVRPSLLLGDREEYRLGERAGKVVMKLLGRFMIGKFKKYRAIEARNVAAAMINILGSAKGKSIYESDVLQEMSEASHIFPV